MQNHQLSNLIILCIYKPPNSDIESFTSKFQKFLKQPIFKNKKIIVSGDINIDLLKSDSHQKTKQFLNEVLSFGLLPLITTPTRITENTSTLIDNIFFNFSHHEYYSRIIYDDVSDHLPIYANII